MKNQQAVASSLETPVAVSSLLEEAPKSGFSARVERSRSWWRGKPEMDLKESLTHTLGMLASAQITLVLLIGFSLAAAEPLLSSIGSSALLFFEGLRRRTYRDWVKVVNEEWDL